jgi:hypothetical protein
MTAAVITSQYASNNPTQRNRIINGAMVIDQRNAGASVTATNSSPYTLDRWTAYSNPSSKFTVQQNAGSVTPPAGYINYLGCTSSSAYSVGATDRNLLIQYIEGLNCTDLAWGTLNAKPVTLSFQVYSSLTGTFGGSITNAAGNRSYPFSYTISSANTWTSISITIAGDTTGTWLTTNGVGIALFFGLGVGSSYSGAAGSWAAAGYYSSTSAVSVVGTNAATFYITGVQLEAGTTATPFEYRSFGQELVLCQRYYETSYDIGTAAGTATWNGAVTVPPSTSSRQVGPSFKVYKRAVPTVTIYAGGNGTSGAIYRTGSTAATTVPDAGQSGFRMSVTGGVALSDDAACHFIAVAEL